MQWKRLTATFLVVATSVSVAEQLPADHYLWGPEASISATPTSGGSCEAATTTIVVPDPACTNGPLTRHCWTPGYSIDTDVDTRWPNTGKTVHYYLELKNTTCDPDGANPRPCQLFNDMLPGPVITADWGDIVSITVKNSLEANGTSVHWHGIRQLNTNVQDGVNGLTECPLAPGDTKTYTWQATEFGSTWYHSHYSSQYGEGARGSIVINGPATANYDVDLGAYPISDWYYPTAFQIEEIADKNLQGPMGPMGPPPADTLLVNGTNKSPNNTGAYAVTALEYGKKYRLRLINIAVDNTVRVSLDNHQFTVISADLVPIKPYTTDWILLTVGQRYDVIFTADQPSGNYWFRAEAARDCASANKYSGKAIFRYSNATIAEPTSTNASVPSICQDEPAVIPWVSKVVPRNTFEEEVGQLGVNIDRVQLETNNQSVLVWGVNMSGIDIMWETPTLQYIIDENDDYPQTYNLIETAGKGQWVYWIIQETEGGPVQIPHPMHLHGHNFYLLGARPNEVFDVETSMASLNFDNPPRRDTAILPGAGWMVLAYPADNPGVWLLHCHIAWHISEGLGVQFLEDKDAITLPGDDWHQTCDNWDAYWDAPIYAKTDSGLRRMRI